MATAGPSKRTASAVALSSLLIVDSRLARDGRLPRPDGDPREAKRATWDRLYGRDQAIAAPDHLSGDNGTDRARLRKPTHELIDELPPLRPLASGRVQLGVHESTQLREAHGRVAPRLVEQSLRGCVEFPLEGALRGRRCHLHDDDMRVLPGAGNLGEQQI